MILPATPTAVQAIVDDRQARELFIVGREMERPPYFIAGKGGDMRLAKALRVCSEDRVMPNSDGSFTVEGSEGRTYRVTDSCSCPQSQKGKTKYCYHLIATCIYVEWQRRLRPVAPVELGTLRAGTAPLPQTYGARQAARALGPVPDADDDALGNACTGAPSSGYPVDDETLPLPLAPTTIDERLAAVPAQEARMTEDAVQYATDTDHVTTAALEAPAPPPATRPLPGPVLLPSLDARTLELSMQAWSAQRQVVKRFLQQELQEGTDYYTLRIGGKATKPALSKAGSEKFMALFQLHATFSQDSATWTMLGQPQGTLCYVCTLHTRGGELIGEGRGARKLQQDNGDINKAVKMAQKSAMVDAILRTGALSDVFTQDLEPEDREAPAPAMAPAPSPSSALRQRIWKIVQYRAPEVKSREAVEAYIQEHTGMALHPDLYQAIVSRLEQENA